MDMDVVAKMRYTMFDERKRIFSIPKRFYTL